MFQRHAAQLLRYASGRVGEQVAEDLVAQAFLTAYEQRDRYDPGRGDLLAWLYGICTNLIRRHRRDERRNLRALQRLSPSSTEGSATDAPSAERVDAQRAVARIAGVLARLPRRQRDVLLLYAIAQLDYQQIAVALQIPLGSVQSSLHRARAKVRLALGASR
jgi:RNA polymerase sigma factor (sigma-70 family)